MRDACTQGQHNFIGGLVPFNLRVAACLWGLEVFGFGYDNWCALSDLESKHICKRPFCMHRRSVIKSAFMRISMRREAWQTSQGGPITGDALLQAGAHPNGSSSQLGPKCSSSPVPALPSPYSYTPFTPERRSANHTPVTSPMHRATATPLCLLSTPLCDSARHAGGLRLLASARSHADRPGRGRHGRGSSLSTGAQRER